MAKKVIATIVKIEGSKNAVCTYGHKVGDRFEFTIQGCNRELCLYALSALLPAVNILLHDGHFSWEKEVQKIYWGCPHPGTMYPGLGQLIFELKVES